jgi:chromosome segregation ATPase
LERVFGTIKPELRTEPSSVNSNQSEPQERTEELRIKLAETLKEVEFLRDKIKDKDERIEDLRQDRDRWHGEFQSLKALPAPPASAAPAPEKRGFWPRIAGKTA